MIDKVQKIREEVKRLREKIMGIRTDFADGQKSVLTELLAFIDTLQKEPVSENLEIAANEWDAKASFTPFYMALDGNGNPYEIKQDYTTHAESFKAGAKWQKEKEYTCYEEAFEDGAKWQKEHMMIKAINAHCFGFQGAALFSFKLPADNYLVGSEVKVIVIKED